MASSIATKDTVTIREVVRDTLVRLQPDTSLLRALIECDSLGRARLHEVLETHAGQYIAPPEVAIDNNNVLTVTAETIDSVGIYMKLKDRYREEVKHKEVTLTVEVNVLTWWQTLWVALGKIFAAAIGICIIGLCARAALKP